MAWTRRQAWSKQEGNGAFTSRSVTLGLTPQTGALIPALLFWYDGGSSSASPSFTDGNSVALSITASSPSNARPASAGIVYLAWYQVPASPSATITCTFTTTTGSGICALWVAEYTPPSAGTIVLDAHANGTAASGVSITTPTLTITGSDDVCVCAAVSDHQVSSVDTPWNQIVAGPPPGGGNFSEGIGDHLNRSTNISVAMTQNQSSGFDSIAGAWMIAAAQDTPELRLVTGRRQMHQLLAT